MNLKIIVEVLRLWDPYLLSTYSVPSMVLVIWYSIYTETLCGESHPWVITQPQDLRAHPKGRLLGSRRAGAPNHNSLHAKAAHFPLDDGYVFLSVIFEACVENEAWHVQSSGLSVWERAGPWGHGRPVGRRARPQLELVTAEQWGRGKIVTMSRPLSHKKVLLDQGLTNRGPGAKLTRHLSP